MSDDPCPMSEAQANAFLEKIKASVELQNAISKAADVDAIVAIAQAEGFTMTPEDFQKAQSESLDTDLEKAAGGFSQNCVLNSSKYVPGSPRFN